MKKNETWGRNTKKQNNQFVMASCGNRQLKVKGTAGVFVVFYNLVELYESLNHV